MSKKVLWMPILMAVAAIIGVFIGKLSNGQFSFPTNQTESYLIKDKSSNKLQSVLDLIDTYYVDNVSSDSLVEKLLPKLLENLDPHTVYIPAKDFEHVASELKSDFGGIGVTFSIKNDTINVVSVVNGGPSSLLGVLPGDKIIKVNGHDFVGKSLTNDIVMDSLRGEIGTKVDISILREKTTLDFSIVRGLIPIHSVDVAYKLSSNIGYLKIDRFAERTYEEMLQGIAKLNSEGCNSLVIDLRSNTGGLLDVVTSMCNEFLSEGDLIVYTEGAHQTRQNAYANGKGICQKTKVVVLIDEYSASASEIFAGAIQDNDRGTIIGRRSFGKGLVQTQIPLHDNSAVRLTVARYHTPSGRCIQRPYDNGVEDYYDDTYNRFNTGELFDANSVKLDSTQIFYTKGGRVVYGGGGIMPDIFIPRDTAMASNTLYKLRAKGLIYNFSIDYCNKHRAELTKFDTQSLINYLLNKKLIDEFSLYAKKNGISTEGTNNEEKKYIEIEIKAYIARNIKDNEAYYPIINQDDPAIEKAIKVLSE